MSAKALLFKIGEEKFAFDLNVLQELVHLPKITRIPRTEGYVKGVINHRGKVIPLCDLFYKNKGRLTPIDNQTVVLVVQYFFQNIEVTLGILANEVLGFMKEDSQDLEKGKEVQWLDIAKDFSVPDLAKEIRYEIERH